MADGPAIPPEADSGPPVSFRLRALLFGFAQLGSLTRARRVAFPVLVGAGAGLPAVREQRFQDGTRAVWIRHEGRRRVLHIETTDARWDLAAAKVARKDLGQAAFDPRRWQGRAGFRVAHEALLDQAEALTHVFPVDGETTAAHRFAVAHTPDAWAAAGTVGPTRVRIVARGWALHDVRLKTR